MVLSILLIIAILMMLPTVYAAIVGAPFAPTLPSQIKEIVEVSGLKDGDKVYELGTGTGQVLISFSKAKNIETVGLELSPFFYLITWLNIKINKAANCNIYFKNFFTTPLHDADIIYCFLMTNTLTKLKRKLIRELRPGAKIISYSFPIDGLKLHTSIGGGTKPKIFFYQIEKQN